MPQKQSPPKIPFQVYGLWLVIRIQREPAGKPEVHCPKGGAMVYGEVTATGDGFDSEARRFRPMPPAGSVIAVEEAGDEVEGHYFYLNDQEYRIVHLDSIIISFPPGE